MSRVVIIGGHGKVALKLIPLLHERGDHVTAVIRNPEHVAVVEGAGASAVFADVETLDTSAIARLIDQHDAVVWSAGAGGGDAARTYAVDRDAAMRTIDAAETTNTSRFVMVSYFGAKPDHGIDPSASFYPYAESKAAADAHLRKSTLEYTILGPSSLTHESGTGLIDTQAETSGEVSRENVAVVIAQALREDRTIGRTIRFNDGTVPVAEALRASQ